MKKIIPTVITLICTLFIAVIPTEAEAMIYEDTIRLHILANSDSEEDQALKLEIRDRLLEKYSAYFTADTDITLAKESIERLLPEIENDCRTWLCDAGRAPVCTASLAIEWYDTREYENFTLPMGYYNSLKITLGEGEGRNWWCVMYPPLCLDAAVSEDTPSYTESENALISQSGYRVKFKILEAISYICRGF